MLHVSLEFFIGVLIGVRVCSVAFSVDDSGTVLLVVLLGDPGRFEGGERSEGGSSLPDGVLTVGSSDNFDLSTGGGSVNELLLESVGHAFEKGGTTGHDDVLAEFSSDLQVGGADGAPGDFVDGFAPNAHEAGLVEELGAFDTEATGDGDDPFVGKGVLLI